MTTNPNSVNSLQHNFETLFQKMDHMETSISNLQVSQVQNQPGFKSSNIYLAKETDLISSYGPTDQELNGKENFAQVEESESYDSWKKEPESPG